MPLWSRSKLSNTWDAVNVHALASALLRGRRVCCSVLSLMPSVVCRTLLECWRLSVARHKGVLGGALPGALRE